MDFDWGELVKPIFSSALQGALQFGGQYFQSQADKDKIKDQRAYEQQKDERNFEQQKELLALKGGGGGGGGGPFTGFTDPQRVQAIQNQNAQQMQAIDAIIKAYQTALLSRR